MKIHIINSKLNHQTPSINHNSQGKLLDTLSIKELINKIICLLI